MDPFDSRPVRPAPPRLARQRSRSINKSSSALSDASLDAVPPTPPLPLSASGGSMFAASGEEMTTDPSLASGMMTPGTLLGRLEGLLLAKSEEIQLAGRLGETLLQQQSDLVARIAELEVRAGSLISESCACAVSAHALT